MMCRMLNVRVSIVLARLRTWLDAGRSRFPFTLAVRLTLTNGALLRLGTMLVAILFRDRSLNWRRGVLLIGHYVSMVFGATLWARIGALRLARVLLGMRECVRVPQIALRNNKVRFKSRAHARTPMIRGSGS